MHFIPSPALSADGAARAVLSAPVTVHADGRCDFRLAGAIDLDATAAVEAEGLRCLELVAVRSLIIGLGGVTFLDAGGLGALVVLLTAGQNLGKDVQLDRVPPNVDRLLRLVGLAEAFDRPSTMAHESTASDTNGPTRARTVP